MYVSRDVLPDLRPTWHGRLAVSVVLALIVALLMSAGIASAAKPSKMSVEVEDAAFGDVIVATVVGDTPTAAKSSGESTEKLWVFGRCYQGDTWVYGEYSLVFGGSAQLQLGPTPSWQEGPADCVAELGYFAKNGKWRVMDSTSFNASG